MSIATCHDCGEYVDTDLSPGNWIELGNMRSQTRDVFICERCMEAREAEQEAREAAEDRALTDNLKAIK